MSNIINNNLLFTETTAGTNSNTSEQTIKDKPSLFDNVLAESVVKEEEVVPKVEEEIVVNKEVKEEDKLEENKSLEQKEVESKEKVASNTTSSLLDRLVIEAKKEVIGINKEEVLNAKIDNVLAESVVKEEEVVPKVEEEIVVNKEVKEEDKLEENKSLEQKEVESKEKVASNTTSSLLDRLVIEAKKEVIGINKEEVLNAKIDNVLAESVVKEEEVVPKVEEEIVVNKEVKEEDKLEENKSLEQKEVESKEKVASNTTSSLLDRLVIEAKKEVIGINKEEVLNAKIDNVLAESVVKEEEVVPKVEEEIVVNKEVKEEDKLEENKSLEQKEVESKEKVASNTTSSLLDRLVIEAKKEVIGINKEEVLNAKIDNVLAESVVKEEEVVPKVEEEIVVNKEVKEEDIKENIDISNTLNSSLLSDKGINSILIPSDENITVVVSEEVNNSEIVIKKNEELSLMDKLIQKNTEIVTLDIIDNNIESSPKEIVAKDLITSIYLGSQKNQVNNQSLFNKNEAVNLLKDGNSIQAIKTSAEILELGLENIEVDQITEVDKLTIKKSIIETVDRKNLIDTILSQKNIKSEEVKNLITKSVEASNALIENSINLAEDVTVNVNSPLSYNIQSRIIGAKQQMSVMMSDIAKQMYENYKPPVTAFKINLNPLDLGSIAILMKTDKNNGLSISLNISNNTTLETLMENQNILRNSLNKTFDENTKFNLDFNSSNQDSSNQSSNNQSNQQNNRRFEQQIDTNSILQMKEENKDKEEKAIDYM